MLPVIHATKDTREEGEQTQPLNIEKMSEMSIYMSIRNPRLFIS